MLKQWCAIKIIQTNRLYANTALEITNMQIKVTLLSAPMT